MRTFTTEDFAGAGQYIIRNDKPAGQYVDPGFMSTIMRKIGWMHGPGAEANIYLMMDMSDGWVCNGYYIGESGNKTYVPFQGETGQQGLQKLCDYLNNPDLSQDYRFATQEEVVRVVMYQKSRWK